MPPSSALPAQHQLPAWLVHHSHAGAGPSCDLRPIADAVHLVAFLYGPSSVLNAHFLSHYLQLGIPPAHMRLFVEDGAVDAAADADASRRTLRILADATVPTAAVTLMPHGNYTDQLMLHLANRHIASLPSDAWVIRADADEHFTYPCDLAVRIAAEQKLILETIVAFLQARRRVCVLL